MSGVAVAVLILGVAASAAVQASGMGGPIALAASLLVVLGALAYLVLRAQRRSPVRRLRGFLETRNAVAPLDGDAYGDHDLDTLERYRQLHAAAIKRFIRRLRERGIIGPHEERRLSNPRTVRDLHTLLDRLADCEAELD